MRKYEKKQCADLIMTLEEAHVEIIKLIEKKNVDSAFELLEQCQQAAIAIGEIIEKSEGEGTEAVRKLEEYCESIYTIGQELTAERRINTRQTEKNLQKHIISAQNSINSLPTRIEAVFFPYKASMWDSLESIWMAADEDPNCDAYVIPIPYYDRNPNGSFAQIHYEADDFPDYVPITSYTTYDVEQHQPDMVFIHNPYDEYNFVTSVHPNFYSHNLKKNTDCLVYVPYYATAGAMADGQSMCSAYIHADYIVVQSKDIINQFDPQIPKEKFLPLGSPKFDRVIRMCNNPPAPPEGWAKKMEGKRVYFYNTSLGGMLEDTESFLKKMEYVFSTFREVKDACLLWRPHPLFESTLDSMRAEYRAEYDRIRNKFIEEDIGIYDTTPDIESTIALCDAYIGDAGTSVISLFEAAGKAVYILDNRVTEKPDMDAWKGMYAIYPGKDSRFNKAVIMPDDKLFWMPDNDLRYEFFCDLPKDKFHWGYCLAFSFGGTIYVFPRNAQEILAISEEPKRVRRISLKKYNIEKEAFDRAMIFGEEYAILIPQKYPYVVRFSFKSERIDYVDGLREQIWTQELGEQRLCACCFSGVYRKTLFCVDNGNRIISLDLDTLETETIVVNFGETMLSMMSDDWSSDRYFWLIPYDGTRVVRWDRENNTFKEYDLMIDGLYSYSTVAHMRVNSYYFSSFAFLKDRVIFAPRWGNKFVELDLETEQVKEWIPPFKIYMENKGPHYITWDRGWFVWDMSGHACGYSNSPERVTYDIDFNSDTAVPVDAPIKEEDVTEQYCKGFTSESIIRPVCCNESPWNTLYDIATEHITGNVFRTEDQRMAFLRINANAEGNCGERIYRSIVDRIV